MRTYVEKPRLPVQEEEEEDSGKAGSEQRQGGEDSDSISTEPPSGLLPTTSPGSAAGHAAAGGAKTDEDTGKPFTHTWVFGVGAGLVADAAILGVGYAGYMLYFKLNPTT